MRAPRAKEGSRIEPGADRQALVQNEERPPNHLSPTEAIRQSGCRQRPFVGPLLF